MKKKIEMDVEFSSIFKDAKWMNSIWIHNFSSRKAKENRKLLDKIAILVSKYNEDKNER